jgi:hypothetical protein
LSKIQQSSDNAKGFRDLSERIKRLEPIFSRMGTDEEAATVAIPLLQDLER